MSFHAHAAAEHFPLMSEKALDELAADIQANTQHEPIVMHEGLILDGRNRWLACQRAGLQPTTREFDPEHEGSPTAFVLSANLYRRHLTGSQRAAIAIKVLPQAEAEAKERRLEGNRRGGEVAGRGRPLDSSSPKVDSTYRPRHAGKAAAEVAKAAGVSPTLVYTAKRLSADASDLFQQVEAGELSLHKAEDELKRRRSAEGGDITPPKPKRNGPRPGTKSERRIEQEAAELEQATRASVAVDVLERLGTCRYSPAEVAEAVRPEQRFRVNEHLKRACDWLEEFRQVWTGNQSDPA